MHHIALHALSHPSWVAPHGHSTVRGPPHISRERKRLKICCPYGT